MSETAQDELRQELAEIVAETRRHLQWMSDAGIRAVRRELPAGQAVPPVSRLPSAPPSAATPGRSRPTFLETNRPPPPSAVPRPPPVNPTHTPAPVARPPQPAPTASSPLAALELIRAELGDCRRCGLCTTRTNIVYGQGNPKAELVFVGEGPEEDEDRSGLPFVGRAGELLNRMIVGMGFTREQVYVCNIVKCLPPENPTTKHRRPDASAIDTCRPFVEQQLRAIRPKVIVALGATAAQSLLRTDVPITKLRNAWASWEGIPVMPTFHPTYLLRAPAEKGKAWDDLKLVVSMLGRELPKK
jgi:uracil-DNA glycosylase family 4